MNCTRAYRQQQIAGIRKRAEYGFESFFVCVQVLRVQADGMSDRTECFRLFPGGTIRVTVADHYYFLKISKFF